MIWGSGGSKSRLAKAAGAEPAGQMRDEKLHAVVAQSKFPGEKVQNTSASDRFWKLRCRKSARGCGAKHISKSKCTKHTILGPLLEVQMSLRFASLQYTTLHYITLQSTTLHYITLHYAPQHYTTLLYTTLHYTTLPSTTLHYITLRSTTLYNYTYDYTTTLHYTKLHYTTLHYTTLHYIPLHSTTLYYITLHYITLNDTAPQIDR